MTMGEFVQASEERPSVEHVTQSKWDSNTLVQAWDGALNRHSDYENLHKSGGTRAQLVELQRNMEGDLDDAKSLVGGEDAVEVSQSPHEGLDHKMANGTEQHQLNIPSVAEDSKGMAPTPPVFPGSINDENLKKLLMSWYYSGYYTGLWEGSQQAQSLGSQSSQTKK